MDWKRYYQHPNMNKWTGRANADTDAYFYQIIKPLNLEWLSSHNNGIAFLGFCCDEGVRRNQGRIGAKAGPAAIRQQLAKIAKHRDLSLFDAGDIICEKRDLESAQMALAEAIALLLANKFFPIILGGGHETAWGHFCGLHKGNPDITIINFDAHFDLREHHESTSGTPFKQIATISDPFDYTVIGIQPDANTESSFQTAKSLNATYMLANTILQGKSPLNTIEPVIIRAKHIYLSICLDVFAAAYAPGVSAVQANGLMPHHIIPAIRALAESGKVMSMDIVELAPEFDQDDRTAKLAALFISEFIHHL